MVVVFDDGNVAAIGDSYGQYWLTITSIINNVCITII